jgi:hypothetical protein
MDLTLNVFSYYAIFCIATLLCVLGLQVQAIRAAGIRFGWWTGTIYYTITAGAILLLAPVFFIVFIFRSERYYNRLIDYLTENFT